MEWSRLLQGSNISKDEVVKNPQAVLDVLEFYTSAVAKPVTKQQQQPIPLSLARNNNNLDLAVSQPDLINSNSKQLGGTSMAKSSSVEDRIDLDVAPELSRISITPKVQRAVVPPPNRPPILPRPSQHHLNASNSSTISSTVQQPSLDTLTKSSAKSTQNALQDSATKPTVEKSSDLANTDRQPRKQDRLSKLTDAQIMEKLRSIVSSGDPTKIYYKMKKVGQGYEKWHKNVLI